MDHETIAMIPQTSEDRITLERAMDVLGLSESNVLAFTRSCPPMLNPYPGNDGILVSQREVQALRIALLAELEAYFAAHPGHLVRLLGSQPFIDAYHVENRKTRQSSTHAA